jgi:XisI protein
MALKLNQAKRIIREVLQELVGMDSTGMIHYDAIFDDEHGRYQVLAIGFEGLRQVIHPLAYLEIKDGLIWLHADNTDYGIAEELERQGIGKDQIVLGFQPASVRQYTDYATGETTETKPLETAAD